MCVAAPAKYRGRLSSFYEIMVVVGTVFGSATSLIFLFDWRVVMAIPMGFVVLHSFSLLLLPESPRLVLCLMLWTQCLIIQYRWLLQNNRRDDAKRSLEIIFVSNEARRIDAELLHLETIVKSSNKPSSRQESAASPQSINFNPKSFVRSIVTRLSSNRLTDVSSSDELVKPQRVSVTVMSGNTSLVLLMKYRLPLVLVVCIIMLSQVTGSVVIRNYAPT